MRTHTLSIAFASLIIFSLFFFLCFNLSIMRARFFLLFFAFVKIKFHHRFSSIIVIFSTINTETGAFCYFVCTFSVSLYLSQSIWFIIVSYRLEMCLLLWLHILRNKKDRLHIKTIQSIGKITSQMNFGSKDFNIFFKVSWTEVENHLIWILC